MDSTTIEVQIDRIMLNGDCLSWEIVMNRKDEDILHSIQWENFNIKASEHYYDDYDDYIHIRAEASAENMLVLVLAQTLGANTYYIYPNNHHQN